MSQTIRDRLFEDLDAAVEGGYGPELDEMSDTAVADDVYDCVPGYDAPPPADLVAEWRVSRGRTQ